MWSKRQILGHMTFAGILSGEGSPALFVPLGFYSGSAVKHLPAMQETKETQVRSLAGEDPLEEERTTHSSILAWEIPWTEQPSGVAKSWT